MKCTRCGSTTVYLDNLCAYCFGYEDAPSDAPRHNAADLEVMVYGLLTALLIVAAVVVAFR